MRALVTGATGFVGRHLVRLLLSREYDVYGTYLSAPAEWEFDAKLLSCDVRDSTSVCKTIDQIRPHRLYHLAAQSSPSESLERIRDVYETNFWGTYNLLEAARQIVPRARILIVGSGQCYGNMGAHRKPLTESTALEPSNPYALSKAAADMLAGQYYSRFGLHVIRARPFNHTGPGQQQGFVCSDYAYRVAAIELGNERPVLRIRDSHARRDFTDVRDVVRAYELLVGKGNPGEAYNVASGRFISIDEIVSMLLSFCSRPVKVSYEHEPAGPRALPNLSGNSLKLRRSTGWKPAYDLSHTLLDLFQYWKAHCNRSLPLKTRKRAESH